MAAISIDCISRWIELSVADIAFASKQKALFSNFNIGTICSGYGTIQQ
jgi:hypothetical protein